jgi:hypothetical protein
MNAREARTLAGGIMTIRTDPTRARMLALAATILLASASCAKHDAPVADTNVGRALAPADTATAPTPAMTTVRGTIAAVSDTALTVTTATGAQQVQIVAPLRVYTRTTSDLAHVTPNSFVGITSVKQPNGSERATEIHIFPEELRGTGEGSRMMDQAAGSRMTNGAVSPSRMTNGSVKSTAGGGATTYTIQYQGGTQTIEIPAGVTVTSIVPAQTKLAVGTSVVVLAHPGADGRPSASTVMLTGHATAK